MSNIHQPKILDHPCFNVLGACRNFSYDNNCLHVTFESDLEVLISGYLQGNDSFITYGLDKFAYQLVETQFQAEREFSSFRFSGSESNTIGYAFPISALSSGSEDKMNRWANIYATAALRSLLDEGIANDFLNDVDLSNLLAQNLNTLLEITNYFPSNLAVLIFGKEQLAQLDASLDDVLLYAMEYGYLRKNTEQPFKIQSEYSSRYSFKKISQLLKNDLSIIDEIMLQASPPVSG